MLLIIFFGVFFFKQKTAYEMRISDWSSDVCSSDLQLLEAPCGLLDFIGQRALTLSAPAATTLLESTAPGLPRSLLLLPPCQLSRSEERRVGKACVRTCRSRWSPYH